MTLPTSGSISSDQIMAELRVANPTRAFPLSLTDADVLALAGKSSPPISIPADLYGKSSYIAMTVTPTDGYGFGNSTSFGGVATCNPSVSVTGGSGGYTYQWAFESNQATCSLSNATGSQCTVSHSYVKTSNGSASATLSCTIADNTGHSVMRSGINSLLEWGN